LIFVGQLFFYSKDAFAILISKTFPSANFASLSSNPAESGQDEGLQQAKYLRAPLKFILSVVVIWKAGWKLIVLDSDAGHRSEQK
jgi:hypothetical protein